MGLDLIPYLEDYACLVAHNSRVFKLKLIYSDWIRQRNKSPLCLESVSRQEAHNQLEEVLRAVLYILERGGQISPIQTENFVVNTTTSLWQLANRTEFVIDGKVMLCHPDCLVFNVHCKQIPVTSKTNINDNCESSRKSTRYQSQRTKGEQNPSNHNKDSQHLSQRDPHEGARRKLRNVPVLHTPCLGPSNRAKSCGLMKKRKPNILKILQKQSPATPIFFKSVKSQDIMSIHKIQRCSASVNNSKFVEKTKEFVRSGSTRQSNSLLQNLEKFREPYRMNPTVSLTDIFKVKSSIQDILRDSTESSDPGTAESLERVATKLRSSRNRRLEIPTPSLSASISKLSQNSVLKNRGKQEDLEVMVCQYASNKRKHSDGRWNKMPRNENKSVQQNTRAVPKRASIDSTSSNSITEEDQGHWKQTPANGDDVETITKAATECIKKYRHQSTHILKGSHREDHGSNYNGNACNGYIGGQEKPNASTEKEVVSQEGVKYLEIKDSDIVELYESGSIISPTYRGASQRRKRRNNSPGHRERRYEADNKDSGVNHHGVLDHSWYSPKKKLYSTHSSFASLGTSDNFQRGNSHQTTRQSNTAFQYYRQKLGEKNKSRQEQKHDSSASSVSESRLPDRRCSPRLSHQTGDNHIVMQYKKVLENVKTKYGSREESKTSDADEFSVKTIHSNKKGSVHKKNATVKKGPERKSSYHQQGHITPISSSLKVGMKGTRVSNKLIISKSGSRVGNARGDFRRHVGSSVSSSPSLRPRKGKLQYRRSTSSLGSPLQPRIGPVRRVNIPNSPSKLESLRYARNRLLTAKDGVWLFDSRHQELGQKRASQSQVETKAKRELSTFRSPSLKASEEDVPSSTSERSYKSASSPCLTTPLLSMPPDPSSSGLGCQAQDETERGPQPSRFWQVLNYIFGGSPKLNAD